MNIQWPSIACCQQAIKSNNSSAKIRYIFITCPKLTADAYPTSGLLLCVGFQLARKKSDNACISPTLRQGCTEN